MANFFGNKKNIGFWGTVGVSILSTVLCVIVGLGILIYFIGDDLLFAFYPCHKEMSLSCLYENWNSNMYITVVTDFYTTIIAILIGLLGILAAAAFVIIRANVIQQVSADIHEEVRNYFIDRDNVIRGQIGEIVRSNYEDKLDAILATLENHGITILEGEGTHLDNSGNPSKSKEETDVK